MLLDAGVALVPVDIRGPFTEDAEKTEADGPGPSDILGGMANEFSPPPSLRGTHAEYGCVGSSVSISTEALNENGGC